MAIVTSSRTIKTCGNQTNHHYHPQDMPRPPAASKLLIVLTALYCASFPQFYKFIITIISD